MTNSSIRLDAASLRAEIAESPQTHDLTPVQVARIQALSDEQLNLALANSADDDFWTAYDAVREQAIAALAATPLVSIVYAAGDDYERAVDAANDNGGSIDAVAAYLAQWDFGKEQDDAAEVNGHTDLAQLERLPHQLHEATVRGQHYWISLDHGLRFYALYRQPLGA